MSGRIKMRTGVGGSGGESKTPQSLLAEAEAHFDRVAASPHLFGMTSETAATAAIMGKKLAAEAIGLEDGQLLDLTTFMSTHASKEDLKRLVIGAIPHVSMSLGLLEMEFVHEECGQIPIDVVRALIEEEDGRREHAGVVLTRDTVRVQYRRRRL